jgi:TolB protein
MAITRQPTSKARYILRAATFVIISVSFAARMSGESVASSAKPSNSLIAFADAPDQRPGPQATQYAQIYTITPDGRNKKQLTMGRPGNFFPAWSPSGEQLVFVSMRNHKHEIWIIDSSGKNERFITSGFLPAWSPDGRQLAITRPHADERRQIWIVGVDGKGEKQLTSEGLNHCPTFSPKGDKIAYWSGDERGFGQIWIMNSDGTQKLQLTYPRKNQYSPDGSSANAPAWLYSEQIAYWSGIEHRYGQVWTMNPDGSNQKQLTDEPAPASSDNPTFSPDGKKIIFDTQRRKRPEIWVMNSDGSDERVLVSDVKVIPMRTSWQPVFSAESSNKPDPGDGK